MTRLRVWLAQHRDRRLHHTSDFCLCRTPLHPTPLGGCQRCGRLPETMIGGNK